LRFKIDIKDHIIQKSEFKNQRSYLAIRNRRYTVQFCGRIVSAPTDFNSQPSTFPPFNLLLLMFNFGILGINARNLHYVGKHNPAKAVRLADNKIVTKKFLTERGIPLPATYAVIRNRSELAQFDFFSVPHANFIIKPARGSRGRGIFRVKKLKDYQPDNSLFVTSLTSPSRWSKWLGGNQAVSHEQEDEQRFDVQGRVTSESLLKTYCLDILDGKESLQGRPDHILIEELLIPGDGFETFCEHGLADIRIIVYNFVPVAAMLRVPTEASEGKANLDRGWVGLWVEVGSGKIQSMFLNGKVYKQSFPDQYAAFLWAKISYREDILQRSTQIQYYVNLWYLALDRVITETWPKLLEINARAWLKVQLALDLPLRHRLEKIGDLKVSSPEKGVEICQTLFTQQKTWLISPSKIIPQHAYATVRIWSDLQHEVTVDIDLKKTGVWIDSLLAPEFTAGREASLWYPYEQIKLPFSERKVDSTLGAHQIVLWGDMVANYFVRPVTPWSRKKELFRPDMIASHEYELLRSLDTKLAHMSAKLVLSRYLKPTNFLDEFDKFLSLQGKYNPVFAYQWPTEKKLFQIGADLAYVHEEFREKTKIESPVVALFEKKLAELVIKQQLLLAYRKQDFDNLFTLQSAYRGEYDPTLYADALQRIDLIKNDRNDLGIVLWRKTMKKEILAYLAARGRNEVEVKFTPETFARMSVKKYGRRLILQISSGATFRKLDLYAALAHELMHLQRYINAMDSSRQILRRGTAGYFVDEEWLAIWAAEQELPDSFEKFSMRKKYVMVQEAMDHNFVQLADQFRDESNKSLLSVFKSVYRLKRGVKDTSIITPGAISLQDTIYALWYTRISRWLESGGNREDMMMGKIKLEDIVYFKEYTFPEQ
jgi:hypothetical protein